MDPASVSPFLLLLPLLFCSTVLVLRKLYGPLGRPRDLPPGSLCLPLLGETVRLISAYKTENPETFVDERLRPGQRVFTTHLFGERTIFSADPEVNRQILQGEGRLFECSYPSSLTTLLGRRSLIVMRGAFHRRMHSLLGATVASPPVIRDRFLPDIDRLIRRTLDSWEENSGVDEPIVGRRVLLQDQAKKITFDLSVKQLMSRDPGPWTEGLRKEYLHLIDGFFSIPLPFSFTTYGRALKARGRVGESLSSVVKERKREMMERGAEERPAETGKKRRYADLLGALLEAESEDGLEFTEEEAVDFLLALLVAGYETTSTIMTLAVKYLSDHPTALALLREEQDEIRRRKEEAGCADDPLNWADYKAMAFTQCVINETMRVASIISGVFRRATVDVPIKGGYTIPKGCKVFASFRAVHMDPTYFADARSFDPWRWRSSPSQKMGGESAFCPFGGGPRFCPGYELTRVQISVFLHYFVTRFSFEPAEEDKVVFFPTTRTVKGCPINVRPRR